MNSHVATQMTFDVVPGRSVVLVKARSNVGPISFATTDVAGKITTVVHDGTFDTDAILEARLEVKLDTLASGNSLYDAEIRRRIDARRYPSAVIELRSAARIGATNRYELSGEIDLHGLTRTIAGTVTADFSQPGSVVVRGEHMFDIRDFQLEVPATLMLKIYPDVWVEMHLEAHAE